MAVLLRCTLQSLTEAVDLEDLGMHSLDDVMRSHKDISIVQEVNFPSWLVEYNKVTLHTLLYAQHTCQQRRWYCSNIPVSPCC